ncbi:MAG: hypothetical protein ACREJM_09855 [Candidatus Saccharimonadales bacterium]
MNKNSLYIVIALAVAVTAGTFFVSKHDTHRSCFMNGIVSEKELLAEPVPGGSVPNIHATVRGYPFWYYQEPFPAGCLSADGLGAGGFSAGHLGDDFLVWLAVSLAALIVLTWGRSLRDKPMFGDKTGGRHA